MLLLLTSLDKKRQFKKIFISLNRGDSLYFDPPLSRLVLDLQKNVKYKLYDF